MRGFTSRSSIFKLTIITGVATENIPKNDVFHMISIATQSVFVASKIGKGEEDLRMILHKFVYIAFFCDQLPKF